MAHLLIHGDNINSLCDFYSFVLDCDLIFDSSGPYFHFDSYKFVFKKSKNSLASDRPIFVLNLALKEMEELEKRLKLFNYKSQNNLPFKKISETALEIFDPCNNVFLVECAL